MGKATIDKALFAYLKDLRENNNRPWFDERKSQYQALVKDFKVFAEEVRSGLEGSDMIEKLKVYRIYRDVRFSKDKTPYKTNFSISMVRATQARRGGYYIQVEPGNSFVGGGFWGPEPKDLKRIREEFDVTTEYMDQIVSDEKFIKYFGELMGDEVKTAPRGYAKDHPAIRYIKKKQFVVMRRFTDKEVLKKDFLDEVVTTLEAMRPFFDYFSDVLTTNLNGESIID